MMKILNRFLETVLALLVALMAAGCLWQVSTIPANIRKNC